MASFNYYLRDGKAEAETSIYLLFDDGVNRAKLYIQKSIHPKDWNPEKGEARRSLKIYAEVNSKLKTIKDKCEELHTSLTKEKKFTLTTFKEQFKNSLDVMNGRIKEVTSGDNRTFETVYDFAKHFLDTVNTSIDGKLKKSGTQKHYKRTLALLKDFEATKKSRITFDRVNLDLYHDFVDYLTRKMKFAPNTIGRHIKTLKLFLNEATERGINTKLDFKSRRFKSVSEQTEAIYLTEDELLKIYEHDFSTTSRLEQTRDLFIIGCYTGLRFSDFSQLTTENISNGQIKINTQKTEQTVVIPIHWTVKAILEKYSDTAKGLPRPITNQKMNKYVKEIGKAVKLNDKIIVTTTKAGLRVQKTVEKHELITTHTARRSMATNLFLSGFPAISIMKITGHKTETAFMSYIRISQEENAKLLQLHWSATTKLKVV